jgi:uncharacterized membrane protein
VSDPTSAENAASSPEPQAQPVSISLPSAGVLPYAQPLMLGAMQPSQAGQIMMLGQVQTQQTVWHGPLPPPDALREYEQILPGSMNRILTMAEAAQNNQHAAVMQAMRFTQFDIRRGHWMGFIFSGLATLIAGYLAWNGQVAVPIALVSIPVMAVGKAFIDSVRANSAPAEIEEKTRANKSENEATSGG